MNEYVWQLKIIVYFCKSCVYLHVWQYNIVDLSTKQNRTLLWNTGLLLLLYAFFQFHV